MSTTLAPPPANWVIPPQRSDLVQVWSLTRTAEQWLLSLTSRIDQSSATLASVSLTGQGASISPTSLPLGTTNAGTYRVSYYARITTAAVTSSSLTISIATTDDGVSVTQSSAAITGNTTSTVGSGSFVMAVDGAAPITYATTYASNGAGEMKYKLTVLAERLL